MPTTYSPTLPLNSSQLTASSKAAMQQGVPVNVIRGVTAFKYGPAASAADFNYVGGQLSSWYKHFYLQSGNALIAWQKAAAQEMGPAASPNDVLLATANQAAATTGMLTAPFFADIGAALTGVGADVGAAVSGEAGLAGQAAGGAGPATAGEAGTSGAGSAADSGLGSAAAKGLASGAAKAVVSAGLADLLGVKGIEALIVRALEALVGIALLFLGLQALTGTGSQGNPVAAAKSVGKYVA